MTAVADVVLAMQKTARLTTEGDRGKCGYDLLVRLIPGSEGEKMNKLMMKFGVPVPLTTKRLLAQT